MDRQMYHYATVSKALQELAEKGYSIDFNLEEQRIVENKDDFTIEHIYRYEGESDPGDEATVYGLRAANGEKGVYVASAGADNENSAGAILNGLTIKGRV